jgi:hypothetical protein
MANLPAFALSIRQPWAWAILHAGKDVENRNWPTRFRGPVCVHAALGMTMAEYDGFIRTVHQVSLTRPFPPGEMVPHMKQLPRGAIVGTAEIIGCVLESASPWFFGPWRFDAMLDQPIPDFGPDIGSRGVACPEDVADGRPEVFRHHAGPGHR